MATKKLLAGVSAQGEETSSTTPDFAHAPSGLRLLKKQPFYGVKYTGRTYDCGDKLGFLSANVAYGLDHPDLAANFRQALKDILADSGGL